MEKLKSKIESILFVHGEPISAGKISKLLKVADEEVVEAIRNLSEDYKNRESGLAILSKNKEYQLSTNPENFKQTQDLVKGEFQSDLSRASLEVLSIIAYRGPVSRAQIEAIRGVNCSFTLRNLLMRGLIERKDSSGGGRVYYYEVSFEFLKYLGLDSISKLPDFEKLSRDERIASVVNLNDN